MLVKLVDGDKDAARASDPEPGIALAGASCLHRFRRAAGKPRDLDAGHREHGRVMLSLSFVDPDPEPTSVNVYSPAAVGRVTSVLLSITESTAATRPKVHCKGRASSTSSA
jgi:hypothetical protein